MKKSNLLSVLTCALLLALTAPSFAAVGLHEAVKNNMVNVAAVQTHGYSAVTMRVDNLLPRTLVIDPVGSSVEPITDDSQRLSLCVIERLEAKGYIVLDPNGSWNGRLSTCCMDANRAGPGGTLYSGIGQTDQRIRDLMAFWREHPSVSQGEINSAVWGHQTLSQLRSRHSRNTPHEHHLQENAPNYNSQAHFRQPAGRDD